MKSKVLFRYQLLISCVLAAAINSSALAYKNTPSVMNNPPPTEDYVVTTTGNILVITDMSGNGETLDVSLVSGNLRFNAAGRTFTLDGGVISPMPVDVLKAGLTSVTINAGAGNDTIKFSTNITSMPSLTVNGDAGDDRVYSFEAIITFLSGANLDLDLTNDAAPGDKDDVELLPNGTIGSAYSLVGNGTATVRVSRKVFVGSRCSITAQNGNLLVEANWNGNTTGNFSGVTLPNLSLIGITNPYTGQLTVRGKGGDTGNDNFGIFVGGGIIRGGTTGITLVEGVGGPSSGNTNYGVRSGNGSGLTTSLGSQLIVNGTGGGTGTSNNNFGVVVWNGGGISGPAGNTVTITGTGGSSTGTGNHGIYITGGLTSADLTMTGSKGANSPGAFDIAVFNTGSIISNGTITANCSSGGGFDPKYGGNFLSFVNSSATEPFSFGPGSMFNYYVGGVNYGVGADALNHHPLKLQGLIDLNDAVLYITGNAHVAVAGNSYWVVINDGSDAITGNFNGLPEGGIIPDFRNSNLDGQISYVGGDGNDAVIFVYPDGDADGISDPFDNCPYTANADQADTDGDGTGDVCDACPADPNNDIDGDGHCADGDNCPDIANADQADADGDGIGDVCDACPNSGSDIDGDDICDAVDNCPNIANADQADADFDGIGDICDACPNDPENDADGDGICGIQTPTEVPVSNWALIMGIALILTFAIIRFRRMI